MPKLNRKSHMIKQCEHEARMAAWERGNHMQALFEHAENRAMVLAEEEADKEPKVKELKDAYEAAVAKVKELRTVHLNGTELAEATTAMLGAMFEYRDMRKEEAKKYYKEPEFNWGPTQEKAYYKEALKSAKRRNGVK